MVATLLPISALAASGTLDDPWVSNTVKVYQSGSTLYVFGSGSMADYSDKADTDWYKVSGNITRLVIESGVDYLGKNAFACLGSLQNIVLKRDVATSNPINMDASALPTTGTVELVVTGNDYMPDYNSNQPWANFKTRITKVTIEEGVKSIGAQAFSGCTKFSSIIIPGSVEYIGKEAFAGTAVSTVKLIHDFTGNKNSGKEFTIGADAFPVSNSGFNISLEISGNSAVPDFTGETKQPWYNYRNYITEVIVDGDVPGIGNFAFANFNRLSNISIYFNEHSLTASKSFGQHTFTSDINKVLNIIGVSEQNAFQYWSGASFSNYKSENTVVGYNAQGMTITGTWEAVQRGVEILPNTDKNYGDLELGYGAQAPYQITVKNSGNAPSGNLHVELSGGMPSAFTVNTKTIASLNPRASAVIAVTPVVGMPIGSYYTKVIITDVDSLTVASMTISFAVGTEASRAARFVMRLYTKCLGRPEAKVTDEEINNWVGQLMAKQLTGAQVAAAFYSSDEYRGRNLNDDQFVESLYEALLDRIPSAAEKAGWVNAIAGGKSREAVFGAFIASAEYKNVATRDTVIPGTIDYTKIDISNKLPASVDAIKFVKRLYMIALARPTDPEIDDPTGLANWSNALTNKKLSAAEVAAGFFSSQEYLNRKRSNKDYATDLYRVMFARVERGVSTEDYDSAGMQNWLNNMAAGMDRVTVFNGFFASVEFNDVCALYGFGPGTVNPKNYNMGPNTDTGKDYAKMDKAAAETLVKKLYNDILKRPADQGGLDGNVNGLVNGTVSLAQIAAGLAGSDEFRGKKFSNEDFLHGIFNALLGRDINGAEMVTYTGTLATTPRATVFAQVAATSESKLYCDYNGYAWTSIDPKKYNMNSPEAKEVVTEANATAFVDHLYTTLFGAVDPTGKINWINALRYGEQSAAQIAASFFASAQYKSLSKSDADFVNDVYLTMLYRDATSDPSSNAWVTALGSATRSQVFAEIIKAAEYTEKSTAHGYGAGGIDPNAYSMN